MRNETFKEQLDSILNCDLKELYPLARELKREIYFFVGPTNSGKTYSAMQELFTAYTATYLAPLRLLALENYEYIKSNNIPVSLVTGEEEIFDEDAGHICSTIEMLNFNLEVDLCVIDEVQMIEDADRGWAWVNAILGTPAKKVILTGSVNALDIIKKLASYLNEPLTIKKFKRKTALEVLNKPTNLKNITKHTALIAFSRNDVLKLKSKLSKYHKVSVLYGNLSPEVRKEEAKKFRDGKSDILIATDAIAMGLNLPIKTLLFTTHTKFDGKSKRKLTPNEVIQISGRAGRFGHHEIGHIGATSRDILNHINHMFHGSLKTIKPPLRVKATSSQVEQLSIYLNTKQLSQILHYFTKYMKYNGPFIATNISTMIELAKIVDTRVALSLEDKYMLASAPINTRSPIIKRAYFTYVNNILNNKITYYKNNINFKRSIKTYDELLKIEDEIKKISLYLWLAYKLPDIFVDKEKALEIQIKLNNYCQKSLTNNHFIRSSKKKFNTRRR